MSYQFDDALRLAIGRRLAGFVRQGGGDSGLTGAAVAFTVIPHEGEAGFLLTRRAAGLARHSGQWALPGGRIDEDETPEEAALRELEEELGLRLSPSDILGRLDDYCTRSGYRITPVVLWARSVEALVPDPGEVASVHRFQLSLLARRPQFVSIPESRRPVIGVPLGEGREMMIHAPTAAILHQFHEVALMGRATRVADYEQPVFAWR